MPSEKVMHFTEEAPDIRMITEMALCLIFMQNIKSRKIELSV